MEARPKVSSEARPKVSSEAAFKTRPKGSLRPRFCRGYRPGLGPRLQKCGLRLHGPIVARFRPRKKTRPKKPRPKAKRALGRVFRSSGRVFKTRPQTPFFVVNQRETIKSQESSLIEVKGYSHSTCFIP